MVIVQGLGVYNQLCTLSFCLVDWAFARGLCRSFEEVVVAYDLRRRQNDANGLVLGFGVEVAQVLVKSVSWVNRCGAFDKFE